MLNDTPISDIMTRYVVTVSPNLTLDKVSDIFAKNNFHHIPVVDGKSLVGIISRKDLDGVSSCVDLFRSKANELYNEKLLKSLLAEEVMTVKTVTVAPNDSIGYAAILFANNKFHALPVVDNGKLVGIITTFDLIEFAYNGTLKPVRTA
jgi:acetoin utilization protein AcuB